MQQFLHPESKNMRYYCTHFICYSDLEPGICAPLVKQPCGCKCWECGQSHTHFLLAFSTHSACTTDVHHSDITGNQIHEIISAFSMCLLRGLSTCLYTAFSKMTCNLSSMFGVNFSFNHFSKLKLCIWLW